MSETKEKTAQIPAVGAAGEQSFPNNITDNNIAENARKFNDEFPWEEQRRILRLMDPHYLHTVSMTELYENVYQSKPPLIDGMLYPGVQLFAGPPKLGKSFFRGCAITNLFKHFKHATSSDTAWSTLPA